MGRRSTAQRLIEELEEDYSTDEVYLVAYDFIEAKPSSRFWGNLEEIIAVAGGFLRVARIVKALAELYGADVRWYAAF